MKEKDDALKACHVTSNQMEVALEWGITTKKLSGEYGGSIRQTITLHRLRRKVKSRRVNANESIIQSEISSIKQKKKEER